MLVNIAILYALTEKFGVWYLLSATVAFGVAVTFNFILNRSWTFSGSGIEGTRIALSYAKFVLVSVIGLGLNLVLLYILVDHFRFWYIFSQVVAILLVAVWNYSGSKLWAFRV